MELVVECIVVTGRPVLVCDKCDLKELGRRQTFNFYSIDQVTNFSPLNRHIDINVGWQQNGRGNYTCPNCKNKG